MSKASAKRCVVCNRPLPTGLGYWVPGLGIVGPSCRAKFAAFERYLEAAGILDAAYGGILVDNDLSGGVLQRLHRAIIHLRRLGVNVDVNDVSEGAKEIVINGFTKPSKSFQKTFKGQSWEEKLEQMKRGDYV
jgi:hypothetical protein